MRRVGASGYSLVELMVALALSGLLVAGALQLHASYNGHARRQDQISQVQQTLRLALTVISRAVRAAGGGTFGGPLQLLACAGPVVYPGVGFSNSNAWPQATFDSTLGDPDSDPDWIVVRTATAEQALVLSYAAGGNTLTIAGTLTGWTAGDLVAIPRPPPQLTMVREITSLAGNQLGFVNGSPNYPCANLLNENDAQRGLATATYPVPIRRFNQEMVFRVVPGVSADDSPKLLVGRGRIGATTGFTWTPIADHVEDLQVALIMRDGRVCNSADAPTVCNAAQAAAMRLTLVGRTPTRVSGVPTSVSGGYEDRPAVQINDGYLRRGVTQEIIFRN